MRIQFKVMNLMKISCIFMKLVMIILFIILIFELIKIMSFIEFYNSIYFKYVQINNSKYIYIYIPIIIYFNYEILQFLKKLLQNN